MERLRFIWMFLIAILVISISNFVLADEELAVFKVVMDQIDISRDGGRTWVTIHSGAKQFDMIALSGGSATQFANIKVPAGTYNRWRVHLISYTAKVTKAVALSGGDTQLISGSLDVWDSGDCRIVIDSGGNTSAIWRLDAEDSYTVHSATDIELDPKITVR